MNYMDRHDNVDVMLNTQRATEILVDENGKACGVVATGETGNTVTVEQPQSLWRRAVSQRTSNCAARPTRSGRDLGDSIRAPTARARPATASR